MAGVVIDVTISHGGNLTDLLDETLEDNGLERYVIHGPRACGPCRKNENPDDVPCSACRGNLADPDHDGDVDSKAGNLCQCRVGIREKNDTKR